MVSHSVFSAAKSELSQHDVFVQLGNNFWLCQFRMGLVHIIWIHPSKSFLKKKKKNSVGGKSLITREICTFLGKYCPKKEVSRTVSFVSLSFGSVAWTAV